MPETEWTHDSIKAGIERFIMDNNRAPTAIDFDLNHFLPSARQIQRAHGGLAMLRKALGYTELDFTKGTARSKIASEAGVRGIEAEEVLELILMKKFGEPYVHSQKRYIRGGKSRYDFFVYAKNYSFGVDVFTTEKREYIEKNVRHKIRKYGETSFRIPIYFVVAGRDYTSNDTEHIQKQLLDKKYPNIQLVTLANFIIYIESLQPLELPKDLKSLL